MNLFTKQKQTHRIRKQTYGYWGKGGEEGQTGVWDWHVHSTTFKRDNQQEATVQHKELCSIFRNNLNGKRIWKRAETCIVVIVLVT